MKKHKNFAAVALVGALIALPAAAQGRGRGHSMPGMGMPGMSGMSGGMTGTQVTKANGVLTNRAGSHTIGRSLTRTNTEGNKTLTITKTAHGRATHTLTHNKTKTKTKTKTMKMKHHGRG